MALQAIDISDLVSSTLRDLGRGKWTDLTTDTQEFHAFNRLMAKKRMEVFEGGYEFQWNVMTGSNGSARSVGIDYTSEVNISDNLIQGHHPFRYITANWGINKYEIAHNAAGPNRIIELIKVRRKAAMVDLVKAFETKFWRCPASTDTVEPHGVQYWINKSATATTTNQGFNGTVPSGYTTVGAINPTTYPRWRNFAAPYTAVTKDDLYQRVDEAMDRTYFKPPVDMPVYNTGDDYEIMTTQTVRRQSKILAESQNDNLGFDLDPAYGRVMYRRTPITWIPILDNDADNPMYGINWGEFFVATLPNAWMQETTFDKLPNQPLMAATHINCAYNFATRNRRRHWVISNGTSGSV